MIESDLMQHIEDERLFSLFRGGRFVKLSWNELTPIEKQQQREAAERANYQADFDPAYLERQGV